MICNVHDTKEQRPNTLPEFEARRVREAIKDKTPQKYSDLDIFIDILQGKRSAMKREEIGSEFAAREHCTKDCALELFDRNRECILGNDHVSRVDHGYYIYE